MSEHEPRRGAGPVIDEPRERPDRFWDMYAKVYDGLLDLVGYRTMLSQVTSAAELTPGLRIVDAGCGSGNLLPVLLDHAPESIVAIDASPAMVARARRKVTDARVRLIEGDIVSKLRRLPAGSVDRVVAVNVLYALPDRPAWWSQVARVLSADGSVVLTHCDRPGSMPLIREHLRESRWRSLLTPRLLAVALADKVIDLRARRREFSFFSYDDLKREAARAGLGHARWLGRCYGGPVDGVNFLAAFSPEPAAGGTGDGA